MKLVITTWRGRQDLLDHVFHGRTREECLQRFKDHMAQDPFLRAAVEQRRGLHATLLWKR